MISDTHGHLNYQAVKTLSGVDMIVHAGDIDTPEVLRQLIDIAPVRAVRGNMDRGRWANELPVTDLVTIDRIVLLALHDVDRLDLDPAAAGIHVVIYGHSHRPLMETRGGVVYVNPGSASLPRHGHLPSVAILNIGDRSVNIEFKDLEDT